MIRWISRFFKLSHFHRDCTTYLIYSLEPVGANSLNDNIYFEIIARLNDRSIILVQFETNRKIHTEITKYSTLCCVLIFCYTSAINISFQILSTWKLSTNFAQHTRERERERDTRVKIFRNKRSITPSRVTVCTISKGSRKNRAFSGRTYFVYGRGKSCQARHIRTCIFAENAQRRRKERRKREQFGSKNFDGLSGWDAFCF